MPNKLTYSKGVLGLLFAIALLAAGCGQNVFKGLTNVETESTVAQSDAVISNPSSTSAEKQTAYQNKGVALLVENGVSVGKILTKVALLNSDDGVTRNSFQQMNEILPLTPTAARECADALNSADALGSNGTPTPTIGVESVTLAPSANNNVQFTRGVANITVVIKMVSLVMTIESDGTPTLNRDISPDWATAITYLCSSSRGIYYYAANAKDAFIKSKALTSSQLTIVNKVAKAGEQMKALYTAYTNHTTFALVDINGTTVYTSTAFTSSSSANEVLLQDCITRIFKLTSQ